MSNGNGEDFKRGLRNLNAMGMPVFVVGTIVIVAVGSALWLEQRFSGVDSRMSKMEASLLSEIRAIGVKTELNGYRIKQLEEQRRDR